jgi:hydroxymethylpyrimidine pyrophosphatase-like HAD family hydrolase
VRFRVLALDYDGTIAQSGKLDPETGAAIREVRERGISVVLVTGRILDDLRKVAGDLSLFDAVVAENGAVLTFPRTGRTFPLAAPVSAALIAAVGKAGIKADAGQCVLEANAEEAERVLGVIRALDLPLVILFNRGRLMVLPQSVSKATGLGEALAALRLSRHNAIGVGDAENDHALLEACELGVAVPWATPGLKRAADVVLAGEGAGAVAAYIRGLGPDLRLSHVGAAPRRVVPLGRGRDGGPATLAIRGRNVLVAGEPGSGKSWITGLLCEQLILEGYSILVIDPEGDYGTLEALPGVLVLGTDGAPSLADLSRALRFPGASVVVDLCTTPESERLAFVPALLKLASEKRRQFGLPHRMVIDEAQYFLGHPEVLTSLDMELASYMFVTYQASGLDPRVRQSSEVLIVTRETDPGEVGALRTALGGSGPDEEWRQTLSGLAVDEAAILEQGSRVPRPFRISPRLTAHVRHRHKYVEVPVAEQQAFVFTRRGVPTGERARTMKELAAVVAQRPAPHLAGHIRRHDFSRWIADVFRDRTTATQVRRLEASLQADPEADSGVRIADAISARYLLGDSPSGGASAV